MGVKNNFSQEEYEKISSDLSRFQEYYEDECEKDLGLENVLMAMYESDCRENSNDKFVSSLKNVKNRFIYGRQGLEKLWRDPEIEDTRAVEFNPYEEWIIDTTKPDKLKVVYEKHECPKCKGDGVIRPIKWLGWFIIPCNRCKGVGQVEIKPKGYHPQQPKEDERIMFLKVYNQNPYIFAYPDDVFVVDR